MMPNSPHITGLAEKEQYLLALVFTPSYAKMTGWREQAKHFGVTDDDIKRALKLAELSRLDDAEATPTKE